MMSATGNRMLLQTASHDTASESVASLTFVPPPSASHAINFTSLSIPKSTSFHANAWLATSFFFFFSSVVSFLSRSLEEQFIFQHGFTAEAAIPEISAITES